jgi:hypothetical protein
MDFALATARKEINQGFQQPLNRRGLGCEDEVAGQYRLFFVTQKQQGAASRQDADFNWFS